MGLLTTLTVGALVGWCCDEKSSILMDAELFTPCVHRWLPSEAHENSGAVRRGRTRDESPQTAAPLILGRVDKVNGIKVTFFNKKPLHTRVF